MEIIARAQLDGALLDGNLRGRPVDGVAAALADRGVPFVFISGYGRESLPRGFNSAPLLSKHFNLTVELPLKAIVRGYTYAVVPINWYNRTTGVSKLKIKEMGSRYLFIVLYVWLEKLLSRGDYVKKDPARERR